MSVKRSRITYDVEPQGYEVPGFPSLYWPFPVGGDQSYYLYRVADVWRFTLLWTLICYAALYLVTAFFAVAIEWRRWRVIWIVPVIWAIVGGIEALIAGSIVGGLLGGLYQAGYFRVSTWIPFIWSLIMSLVLILSSFSMQGGL